MSFTSLVLSNLFQPHTNLETFKAWSYYYTCTLFCIGIHSPKKKKNGNRVINQTISVYPLKYKMKNDISHNILRCLINSSLRLVSVGNKKPIKMLHLLPPQLLRSNDGDNFHISPQSWDQIFLRFDFSISDLFFKGNIAVRLGFSVRKKIHLWISTKAMQILGYVLYPRKAIWYTI